MFTGSTKLPPTKTPQPERLDEVYAALRRGLQWVNTSQALFALIPVEGCQVRYHWMRGYDWYWVLERQSKGNGMFVVRSYLQVHQLELDSLGQQIRENKRNGRLVRAHVVKPVTPVSTIIHYRAGCSRLQSSVRMLIWSFVMLNVFIHVVYFAGVFVWPG